MPYTHKKVGNKYVVYKNGKKVGSTEGTKTALDKYLAALHIADKPKKESVKENMLPQQDMLGTAPTVQSWDHPGCDDKVGKMFVVLKPSSHSSMEDLVHETHAFGMGQFDPQGVHGVYADLEEANLVAEAAVDELHKHLAKVEKKKDHVLSELDKHVARLQKEINAHMKEATDRPELAEGHHQLAEKKMNMIKNLREKHKAIKATKRELPENPLKTNKK